MTIKTAIDCNQSDSGSRANKPVCPHCGGVLTEIVSVESRALIRHKCRRCRNYIMVRAEK